MQDDRDSGNDDSGDGGYRPSAYPNQVSSPNVAQFELPSDDDDDDRWMEKASPIFDRLGRPKDPSGYRWNSDNDPDFGPLSTDDRGYRDTMSRVFHNAGLSPRQVAKLEKAQLQYMKTQRDARSAKRQDGAKNSRAELGKQWGSEFNSRVTKANVAFKSLAGRDAGALAHMELANGELLRDNPAFIRMMAAAAENMSPNAARASTPDGAREQIQEITEEAVRRGLDPTHRNWPHEKLQALYQTMEGDEPLETSMDGGSGVMKRRR